MNSCVLLGILCSRVQRYLSEVLLSTFRHPENYQPLVRLLGWLCKVVRRRWAQFVSLRLFICLRLCVLRLEGDGGCRVAGAGVSWKRVRFTRKKPHVSVFPPWRCEKDVRNLRCCLACALGLLVIDFSCALWLAAHGKVGPTGEWDGFWGLFIQRIRRASSCSGRIHYVWQSFDRTSCPVGSARKLSEIPRGIAGGRRRSGP